MSKENNKLIEIVPRDGRPITCPTLRGMRMGLYQCTEGGAICYWGCNKFSTGTKLFYCGYWSKSSGFLGLSTTRGWNFRVPDTACKGCPHYERIKK